MIYFDVELLRVLAILALIVAGAFALIEALHRLVAWADDDIVVRTREEFEARNVMYRAIRRARNL